MLSESIFSQVVRRLRIIVSGSQVLPIKQQELGWPGDLEVSGSRHVACVEKLLSVEGG